MRIDQFNIYEYESSRVILCSYLENRKEVDPKFSVRKWAKDLELSSHSLLSLQIQGKRKIKTQHISRLAESMGLSEVEGRYFKGLTILEKSTTEEERQYNLSHLIQSIPTKKVMTKQFKSFKLVSNWVYMGILSLSELDGFVMSEETILEKLGHRVSRGQLLDCLHLLTTEGLLNEKNGIYFPNYGSVTSRNDYSDAGIREYHKGACDLAKEAVDSLDLDQREFQSLCLGIPLEKMDLAKELIRKFRDDFYHAVGGSGDEIYKMNIQLFQLSRSTAEDQTSSAGAREFAERMQ
jgi:uncharacterized protein (TIGR02147 family)